MGIVVGRMIKVIGNEVELFAKIMMPTMMIVSITNGINPIIIVMRFIPFGISLNVKKLDIIVIMTLSDNMMIVDSVVNSEVPDSNNFGAMAIAIKFKKVVPMIKNVRL